MKKLLLYILLAIIVPVAAHGATAPALAPDKNSTIHFSGLVKDKLTGMELPEARGIRYNSKGEPVDTFSCMNRIVTTDGEELVLSHFYVSGDRSEGTLTFDIECEGYNTYTVVKDLTAIPPRQTMVTLPAIMLERAPRKLQEVTVTSSKIKFYNRGDTLVYNADAFNLAEGAMLDELMAKLPGVELKEGGAIYVNGEFVETLLLNGRDFFKGNNKIMLENIGAYTVKNVEVYRGQTIEEKWLGDPTAEKHLTMNVKLKKEYLNARMANMQAGYGTDNRYMGRLFASLITPTSMVSLIGNINNVSDTRKPGKNDSWTPEAMPTGTKRNKLIGLDYSFQSKDSSRGLDGHATYEEERSDRRTSTYRTNFLPGGDTYEYSFADDRVRNLKFDTRHTGRLYTEKFFFSGMALARWSRRNTLGDRASGSFRAEQDSMSRAALEALYSDGSPERLDAVINRSISRNDGVRTSAEVQGFAGIHYKTPVVGQTLSDEIGFKYRIDRDHGFDDYMINYGDNPVASTRRRNYTDVSPNSTLTLMNNLTYTVRIAYRMSMSFNYELRHVDTRKNSSLFALDRLADMGVYGTLPAGWTEAFDPSNSYTSRTQENKNTLQMRYSYNIEREKWELNLMVTPEVALSHRRLDYGSDMKDYKVSRDSYLLTFNQGRTRVLFAWDPQEDPKNKSVRLVARNWLTYEFGMTSRLPDLLHMVDVVNDANPLNINKGNPDLKVAYTTTNRLTWDWRPSRLNARNSLSVIYTRTANNLVRGYFYDTNTGVRVNRTYNVSGDYSFSADNHFTRQFGSKKQFGITSETSAGIARNVDMIGVDAVEPTAFAVRNRTLHQKLDFNWEIGSQSIAVFGEVTDRHTGSARPDFRAINAQHYKCGLNGVFALPGNLTLTTSFSVYSRHGYGVKELDTSSKVWDMRLALPLRKGQWVIMADGFDLLHQLSNVSYAVNAQGRSVVYTNTIPRYMMVSVQYRFNINPKDVHYTKVIRF